MSRTAATSIGKLGRLTLPVCAAALVLLVFSGIASPSSLASRPHQTRAQTAQLWADRAVGVVDGRLVWTGDVPPALAQPYGVATALSGDVVGGRTYLSFPVRVLPVGTDVKRALLYVYADMASRPGEALLGAYRVAAPWGELVPGGDRASWPDLAGSPTAVSVAEVSASQVAAYRWDGGNGRAGVGWVRAVGHDRNPLGPLGSSARPPGLAVPIAQQQLRIRFEPAQTVLAVGDTTELAVRVDGANGLRWAEFVIRYDPAIVDVIDSDETADGVQVDLGPFFGSPNLIRNLAIPERGAIEVAQEVSGAPVSGSGVLVRITFRGRSPGTSGLEFSDVVFEGEEGQDHAASIESGTLMVPADSELEGTSTPTITVEASQSSRSTPEATPTDVVATPTATPPGSPLPTPIPPALAGRAIPLERFDGIWISWDVTTLVRAWVADEAMDYGLAIASGPTADAGPDAAGDLLLARWASARVLETAPYLVVEYDVLPVTPTPLSLLPPAGERQPARAAGLVVLGLIGLVLAVAGVRMALRRS